MWPKIDWPSFEKIFSYDKGSSKSNFYAGYLVTLKKVYVSGLRYAQKKYLLVGHCSSAVFKSF